MENIEKSKELERTLGIDVGGTHIRWVISSVSEHGEVSKLKTPKTYDALLKMLTEIIVEVEVSSKIEVVGIGLPGRTGPNKPIWIPILPYLNQSNFATDLMASTKSQVILINDAQAALVGEVDFGVARGCRNAIIVTLGTGIGGGVMIDGKIYVGHNGTAGSFGWLLAPVRLHSNPEHGPWERWAAGTSLINIARELNLSVQEILSPEVLAKNDVAKNALLDFTCRIGKGLGSVASLFDPQVIIVSGGLVDSWSVLAEGVSVGFIEASSPSVRNTPIRVGNLGSKSGAIGAAGMARKYFSELRK